MTADTNEDRLYSDPDYYATIQKWKIGAIVVLLLVLWAVEGFPGVLS